MMRRRWTQRFRIGYLLAAFALLLVKCSARVKEGEAMRAGQLSRTEIKYRLREKFHDKILFCGPPVGIMSVDPAERFKQFPVIVGDAEKFQAIVQHENLSETGPWSDQDKQLVIREHTILSAIVLEPVGEKYTFRLRVPGIEPVGPGRPHLPPNAFLIEGSVDQNGNINISRKEPIFHSCPR